MIKKNCKVKGHCHYSGKDRNAAHSICNWKYSIAAKIPVLFHNGSNYDYFFMKKLEKTVWRKIWLFRRIYWKLQNIFSFSNNRR